MRQPFHRIPLVHLPLGLLIGAGVGLTSGEPAVAQSGRQRMVVVNETDGAPPEVLHFSMPDLHEIRDPDYVRRDLPDFNAQLRIDEIKKLVVSSLLDGYLNAFNELARTALPAPEENGLHLGMGHEMTLDFGPDVGGGGPDGESIGDLLREAIGGEDGPYNGMDVDIAGGQVAIMIEAGAGPTGFGGGGGGDVEIDAFDEGDPDSESPVGGVFIGGAPGDESSANVMIQVAGMDDVEIPEELMEKLAQKAQEMAERLQTQMDENEAEGLDPLAGAIDPVEMMQQRREHIAELQERIKAFKTGRDALRRSFEHEVQGQLSPEQLDRWPHLVRTLTRHKTLPKGRLDGERTDVIEMFDRFGPSDDERTSAAEPLERYELALHGALVARNAYLVDAETKIDEAIQENKPERAALIADRAAKLRVAVRQTNHEASEEIAGVLEDERAAEFRRLIAEHAFPRIYRPTRGLKAFDAVQRLDDVDEQTMATIGEWRSAYLGELEQTNERIRATVERHQPDESRKSLEHLATIFEPGGVMPGDDDDPIREAFDRRKTLDEKYLAMLRQVLPPETVASVKALAPKRPREPMIIRRVSGGER
jgi:hypothetical protein